jgi:DivIVA domain-containing protein
MTPDDVHTVGFGRPPFGKRGYDEHAVDDLLDRIEGSLCGEPQITLEEITAVTIPKPPLGHRGYEKHEVDQFLERVISEWPDRH